MTRFLSVLLLSIVLSGCGVFGSDDSPAPNLDGTYQTGYATPQVNTTLQMTLSEQYPEISGDGTISVEDRDSPRIQEWDVSISGTHDHPNLSLELDVPESVARFQGKFRFEGEVLSEDLVRGTLTTPDGLTFEVEMSRI